MRTPTVQAEGGEGRVRRKGLPEADKGLVSERVVCSGTLLRAAHTHMPTGTILTVRGTYPTAQRTWAGNEGGAPTTPMTAPAPAHYRATG